MIFGAQYFSKNRSSTNRSKTLKVVFASLVFWALFHAPASASEYEYQLFKNKENFGVVIFPKSNIFEALDKYIQSIEFKSVDSGDAVMRFGPTDHDNQTYMMPESVQKKHAIEKFIILQVLADQGILVGVYDPKWGLTLPFATYNLESIQENIQKTLDIFRSKPTDDGNKEQGKTILWSPD